MFVFMIRRGIWTLALGMMIGAASAQNIATQPDVPRPVTGTTAAQLDSIEYKLTPGDVLEFSVRGFPDLRQKAMIELDGDISLPLAGRVRVIGMTLADAQTAVKELAVMRPLQQRLGDGREVYVALSGDDVNVTIAEYRPVYVSGDVGRPGELPFRPGMTVRQAIALAGGFDIMRYRLVNPFTESADFRGQHEALWTEAARARFRLARLQEEQKGSSKLQEVQTSDIPLRAEYINDILRIEQETLLSRMGDLAKERRHMRGLIEQTAAKVQTFEKLVASEEEGVKADQREYDQIMDFSKRGTVPLSRLMEIRRLQLTSATRLLQTRVQLEQARRDLVEAQRNLDRFDTNRQADLMTQQQDQAVVYNTLMVRLAANAEKLTHTSLLKSRLVRGPGAKANILVHRSLLDLARTIKADEQTALLPGDTVEIALQNEFDADVMVRERAASSNTTVQR
jgi:polysaccharide biosynthesis/export protein